MDAPVASAAARARSSATLETSSAVTSQPRSASQTASAPSPQPTSSARPGASRSTSATSAPFGRPLQTRSASAYRASQSGPPAVGFIPPPFEGPRSTARERIHHPEGHFPYVDPPSA